MKYTISLIQLKNSTVFNKDPCLTMSSSPHSPHNIIPTLIAPSTSVLDVGCNTGYFAKILKKKGVVTDGIDINSKALKIAKKYCDHVFKRDLYTGRLSIPRKKYDYIIFADVLEHLPRPDLLLGDAKKHLTDKGTIIISLPNVARIEIRLQLLLGKFDYTDAGILGEDHLRFFSKESGIKFINETGLEVVDIIPTGLGHKINFFTTLTAFQFIYVCKKN